MFSVEDEEHMNRWGTWFENRFKPVYLRHMAALKGSKASPSIDKVDSDLSNKEKLSYLNKVDVPDSEKDRVYGERTSPFLDAEITEYRTAVFQYLKSTKASLREKLKEKTKPSDAADSTDKNTKDTVSKQSSDKEKEQTDSPSSMAEFKQTVSDRNAALFEKD